MGLGGYAINGFSYVDPDNLIRDLGSTNINKQFQNVNAYKAEEAEYTWFPVLHHLTDEEVKKIEKQEERNARYAKRRK